MKKVVLFAVLSILILSCQKDYDKVLKEKINSELKTGVRNDTILLGYYFGMSKEDVSEHTNSLLERNKLFLDEAGICRYLLRDDIQPAINVEYFNGKLFEFYLIFDSNYDLTVAKTDFLNKYGNPVIPDFDDSDFMSKDWFWIKGNLKIFTSVDKYQLKYVDVPKEIQKAIQDSIDYEKRYNQTLKDI